jgi:hypothetical protein
MIGNGGNAHQHGSASSTKSHPRVEHYRAECPDVEFTGIALEYGTQSFLEVLNALRADQWLANHPGAPATARSAIKRQICDAFYGDADDWRGMVYGQARAAVLQALAGLRGPQR